MDSAVSYGSCLGPVKPGMTRSATVFKAKPTRLKQIVDQAILYTQLLMMPGRFILPSLIKIAQTLLK